MRAVTLDSFDAAPAVREDLPDPTAAADGLVVRVGDLEGGDPCRDGLANEGSASLTRF